MHKKESLQNSLLLNMNHSRNLLRRAQSEGTEILKTESKPNHKSVLTKSHQARAEQVCLASFLHSLFYFYSFTRAPTSQDCVCLQERRKFGRDHFPGMWGLCVFITLRLWNCFCFQACLTEKGQLDWVGSVWAQ